MFYDDSLQELRSDPRIPYSFGINHDDRPACANAEARSLAALHSVRTEQQTLSLEQLGQK